MSFRLANEEYGVNIMHVQEIILIGQITQMPQVPEYVRGLINLRGHVIPILDLRVRFDLLNVHDVHTVFFVRNTQARPVVTDQRDYRRVRSDCGPRRHIGPRRYIGG